MIERTLLQGLNLSTDPKKAIIILGPRQAGKTTLVKTFANSLKREYTYTSGDDPTIRNLWKPENVTTVIQLIGNKKLVIIDEAQALENIGLLVKILIDRELDYQFVITGSTALELANQTFESLTGRYKDYRLLPVSLDEIRKTYGLMEVIENLPNRLVFGSYPEVVTKAEMARDVVVNIAQSYLYKDILSLSGLRKPQILDNLLKALSWQVGSQVSYSELSRSLGIDVKTIDHYINILEKNFVLFVLPSFARNLRSELSRSKKIYFYDNGIRNSVINNFSSIPMRSDVGQLWENYLISERIKWLKNSNIQANQYFWRTVNQTEIDYIEETDGRISAFEFKYNPNNKAKISGSFIEAYQPVETRQIHQENYWEWLSDPK
ncbi:MAG: ATP-binding protein [Bacteroidales bacterium]